MSEGCESSEWHEERSVVDAGRDMRRHEDAERSEFYRMHPEYDFPEYSDDEICIMSGWRRQEKSQKWREAVRQRRRAKEKRKKMRRRLRLAMGQLETPQPMEEAMG